MRIISGFLRRLSPTCRDAAQLASRSLDEPLALQDRIGLKLHLVLCGWCRRYVRQLAFLKATLRARERHGDDCAEARLSTEGRERLKRLMAGSGD